jgi:cytochrome oxidase Cu insertion factor (SCO1/SenC/PrrC family)
MNSTLVLGFESLLFELIYPRVYPVCFEEDSMIRLVMILVLMAALALLAGCPSSGGNSNSSSPATSSSSGGIKAAGGGSLGTAKDFTYAKYDGGEGKLSNLAGKVTVVNFWAVW